MNNPTHEEISRRAHELWQSRHPAANDAIQNWLEAERELRSAAAKAAVSPTASAFRLGTSHDDTANQAAQRTAQKLQAREPIVATHTGPKLVPAETGKPLWSRPHSS